MKSLHFSQNLNNSENNKKLAKYLQLAENIRLAIRDGQLLPNEALPSVKQLGDMLAVNRHTVMKGLAELVAEGWLESQERIGYRVVADLPIETSIIINSQSKGKLAGSSKADHEEFNFQLVKRGCPLPEYPSNTYQYNFTGGQPDMSLFPFAEFKSQMSDVLTRVDTSKFGYGDSAGDVGLIEEIKVYLRRVRALTNKEVVITNGSQEALFIIAQLLLQAGDKVAVENLGYPPAWAAFKSSGAELIGIPQDQFGMMPLILEEKIKLGQIKLIYLTPLHQYPTTVTLPISRRMKIYQLARQYKIPIIEDDYDHEFHYSCQPLAPMASDDPIGLVIYISTFSKIMFPGARIGFIAVNKSLAQAVAEYRLLICHKGNVLMQSALSRWMKSGEFERHLRRVTRKYQQRRDHAVQLLSKESIFNFEVPDGGMALWLKITNEEISARGLVAKAKKQGIYLQHEGDFQLNDEVNSDSYLRLGFASMDEETFAQGIALIKNIII
ncbi:MAG: PLP-dependent aminotransferase family protein [Colwellia sp.]|nr:PLP-dependent aminotransferase family protein [Colwellia sp.]